MNPLRIKYYSHMWAVIHLSALNYDKKVDSEEEYTNFYSGLCCTLGCSVNEMRGESTYCREDTKIFWST